MVSRFPLVGLVTVVGLAASVGCSAQGDQPETGLDNHGASGGTSGVPTQGGTGGTGGTSIPLGGGGNSSGAGGSGANPSQICQGMGARLKAVLRDFQPMRHPDFEPHLTKTSAGSFYNRLDPGIVQPVIDPNTRKPLYGGPAGGTLTTNGPDYFPSWFTDVGMVNGVNINMSADIYLDFMESAPGSGLYVFDRRPFLPADDGSPSCPVMPATPCMLGNSTNFATHNYALTLEFHTKFIYKPGLSFLFAGDDDVWVFVDGKLALDLGGIHQRMEARLNLDAANPPLNVGQEYILDFFWAERHVSDANFRVETSLDFINCSIDVPK